MILKKNLLKSSLRRPLSQITCVSYALGIGTRSHCRNRLVRLIDLLVIDGCDLGRTSNIAIVIYL